MSKPEKKLYKITTINKGFVTKEEMKLVKLEKYEIYRLCEKGILTHIYRKIYRVNAKPLSVEKIITALIPGAVFGLRYSLYRFGMRTRKTYDVFVPENTQLDDLPEIVKKLNVNYFYYPQSMNYRNAGIRTVEKGQYYFYNYERTICDAFSRYKEAHLTERWYRDIAREYVKKHKKPPDRDKCFELIKNYSERLNLNEKVKDELDKYIFKEIKRKRNRSGYTCKRKPEEWF